MVTTLGYVLAAAGLYCLYAGLIFVGTVFLAIGGLLSGGFTLGLSSSALLCLSAALSYGFHHQFTPTVIFVCVLAGLLATFARGRGAWEPDLGIGLADLGDHGGCGDGGDGGCGD